MTNSIYCDRCDDGKIQDPENLDYDLQGDPGEYVYCGGYIDCPVCNGTGLSNKGESQEHIGVQAIPGLTSTPRHGADHSASGTSEGPRGAETVALSSEAECLLSACNLLMLKRSELAYGCVAAFAIVDHAYQKLSYDLRVLLTGGAL